MNRKILIIGAALTGASLALPVAPALAQNSVQDFKLKPGEPTAPSRAQGPVDADAPIRAPEPSPEPAPPPTIAVPPPKAAPTVSVPTARATAAAPANRPSPAATVAPTAMPEAMPTAAEAPIATGTAPAFPELASPVPEVEPAAPVERVLPPAEDTPAIPLWAWLATGLAALLGAGAWFFLRDRKPKPPVLLEPAPRPQPRPQQVPAPEAPRPPAQARPTSGIDLQLTARSLNSSLFMATLQYRIALENTGTVALGPIAIAGDMIAAHASLSPQEQIAAAGQELAQLHRIEELQPGQTVELTGEIRLPHSAITPIRQRNALFFVPLVRVYALGTEAGNVIGGGTFVIGEPPATPGGRLRPFRLDLGPRNYPTLEQRKVVTPDAMPLDGRAMAG